MFTQTGGTITVVDTDGTLQFDAPFTQNGGDLANIGKVVGKIAPVGGVNPPTLTLPVRNGTVPDPADPAGGEHGFCPKKAKGGRTLERN